MKKQNESKAKRVFNLIIVDESGSMSVIRKQAFAGMNETLQTVREMQKKYPDTNQYVTLVTFDSDHTKWHYDNTLLIPGTSTGRLTIRVLPLRSMTRWGKPYRRSMPR